MRNWKFKKKIDQDSLIGSMLIYSIGSFGSRVLNFSIYPLLTYFLLKAELGFYDMVISTIYLMVPLGTLQIGDGIYRELLLANTYEHKQKIVSSGIRIFLLVLVPIVLLVFLTVIWFYEVKYHILILSMTYLYAINVTLKQVVRGLRKNKIYVISDILYSFVFVLSSLAFLFFFDNKLRNVLIAFILTNIISVFYLLLSSNILSLFSFKHFCSETKKKLLNYSIPLIPNSISWWLVGSANTYIVTSILGLSHNGIYAIAFKFSSIIYIINKVFSLAWQDQIIMQKDKGYNYNSKVFNRLAFFLTGIVLVIIILLKPILSILVASEFYEAWKFAPFLLIATVFSSFSAYFGAFYLKWGETKKIFTTTIIGALVTIVTSIFLTQKYGLLGTSLSVLLGFLLVAFLRWYDTRNRINIKLDFRVVIILFLIAISITINYNL